MNKKTIIKSEIDFIKKIKKKMPICNKNLIYGIGDDSAVIRDNKNNILITTDILVEDTHFKKKWSLSEEIAHKAIECNISDIIAMGGSPTFMFISIIISNNSLIWIKKIYNYIIKLCNKYKIIIAGGDTTKGQINAINITLLGTIIYNKISLRSHAEPKDIVAITGPVGASKIGLSSIIKKNKISKYIRKRHISPNSNLKKGIKISPIINAMIDITDGLGNELNQLCEKSEIGIKIYEKLIPVNNHTKVLTKWNKKKISEILISSGEELELLFTFPPSKINLINNIDFTYYIIGNTTKIKKERIFIKKSGKISNLTKGFDHFNKNF